MRGYYKLVYFYSFDYNIFKTIDNIKKSYIKKFKCFDEILSNRCDRDVEIMKFVENNKNYYVEYVDGDGGIKTVVDFNLSDFILETSKTHKYGLVVKKMIDKYKEFKFIVTIKYIHDNFLDYNIVNNVLVGFKTKEYKIYKKPTVVIAFKEEKCLFKLMDNLEQYSKVTQVEYINNDNGDLIDYSSQAKRKQLIYNLYEKSEN